MRGQTRRAPPLLLLLPSPPSPSPFPPRPPRYVGVLLELLWGWAAEQDLAVIISSRAAGAIVSMLASYATGQEADRLQHMNYLLNLCIAMVRQRVSPAPLLDAGLVGSLGAVVDSILAKAASGAMLSQRPLVLQARAVPLPVPAAPEGGRE